MWNSPMTEGRARLFLIDGMALLFRSFYAMGQAQLTAPDGTPTGAVYGFLRVISKILKEQNPSHFAVLWDTKDKTFRHEIFPAYKANRSEPPEDIIPQIGLIQKILPELGMPSFRQPGFEADDLIGTFALQARPWADVFIVSADKDFMQLVDEQVKMFSLKKGDDYVVIDGHYVEDYFGVPPDKVVDVLAIIGDKVDNVPGVHGIGEKGAAKLIQEFGSLEGVYDNLDRITARKQREALASSHEQALLSKRLVIIDTQVPVQVSPGDLRYTYEKLVTQPQLKVVLNDLRMHSLLRQLVGDQAGFEKIHAATPASQRTASEPLRLFDDEAQGAQQGVSEDPQGAGGQDAAATGNKQDVHDKTTLWHARNYHLVTTWIQLQRVMDRLASPTTQLVAFDTETTGLDFMADRPIGFALAFEPGEAFYVPAAPEHLARINTLLSGALEEGAHDASALEGILDNETKVWQSLADAVARSKATFVAHNAKFDWHMLCNVGCDLAQTGGRVACSMVGAWLKDAQSGGYGLDNQTFQVLGLEKIPTNALIGPKSGRSSMLEVPLEQITEYACEDVDATLRLWRALEPDLREKGLWALFWELEMPLLGVLVRMERAGVHLDSNALANLTVEIQDSLVDLEQKVFELAGETFKLSSPKQLGAILFEKMKVHEQLGFKGKMAKTTLGYKTDAAVLEQFSDHPIVAAVQEYRELSKLLSTYVLVLPQLVKEKTGRIHTHFHQIGTSTGRLSSSDPNLQNIPVRTKLGQRVRAAFAAPSSDWRIVTVDYSQIELRVLAELAQDPDMIAAFLSGADIHRETAAKIAGKAPAEVTLAERSAAKAINFGIIYGMGPQRLARDQGVSIAEARAFIDKYFLNFSRIRSFIEAKRAFAHQHGYVTTAFGRRRPLPQLQSRNMGEVRQAENMAINSPIQGTAADIMKLGMLKVDELMRGSGLRARLLLQVHDELVFECPADEVDPLSQLVQGALQSVVSFQVPLTVEVGVGHNWAEAK
jgi:DNA polymerase-1